MERLEKVRLLADAALDRKAEDVAALDVRELSSFADSFLVATGRSDRHVRSIADAVVEAARLSGEKPIGMEGYDEGRWVLIDLNDVILHVFRQDVRDHYSLERLWSDAPGIQVGDTAPGRVAR